MGDLLDRIERLQSDLKVRGREVDALKRKLATGGAGTGDAPVDVEGVKLLTRNVGEAGPKVMRDAADALRDRLASGVVVLGCERDGKGNLLVAVTKDLRDRVHAGKLVGTLASHIEGRGGGRPDMAQAGGPNAAGLDAALEAAAEALRAQLAGT
jgi:alanyl-tRNA synthetase